ncbi:MAG: hypothetical protein KDC26_09040 [Armatimonadetes bacterium]|nr:hypothetical protein [Armatimonadota bacterium]
MPNCPRCQKGFEEGATSCSYCGLDFSKVSFEKEIDENAKPCTNHPKVTTGLTCGRCGQPFCDKCLQLGTAGPRCRACAKHDIAFRPGAVALEAKRGVRTLFGGMGGWGRWILAMILLSAFWRGCSMITSRNEPVYDDPPQSQDQQKEAE